MTLERKSKVTITPHHIDMGYCRDTEIYAPLVFDGVVSKYYISTNGSVVSLHRGTITELKPSKDSGGYSRIGLRFQSSDDVWYMASFSIHRLVALVFIPNPKNKPEVNHIDGNKSNSSIYNLEWVDRSENIKHAYATGLNHRGSANVQHIYTDQQIHDVCRMLEENTLSKVQIWELTGIPPYTITAIQTGRKWKHISSSYNIAYTVEAVNTGSTPHYTEADIELVCQYLESGELTLREIANVTKVSFNVVCDVKRHRTWRRISSKYDF